MSSSTDSSATGQIAAVILLAGGASARFHQAKRSAEGGAAREDSESGENNVENKVYLPFVRQGKKTCALKSALGDLITGLNSCAPAPKTILIQPVIRQGEEQHLQTALDTYALDEGGRARVITLPAVVGGETRRQSVQAGLVGMRKNLQQDLGQAMDSQKIHSQKMSADEVEEVWVHDAARPFIPSAMIQRLRHTFLSSDVAGVFPALPVSDALRQVDSALAPATPQRSSPPPQLVKNLSRQGVVRTQTPQVFRLSALTKAHEAKAHELAITGESEDTKNQDAEYNADDDAGLVAATGGAVAAVLGAEVAHKITTEEDFQRVQKTFTSASLPMRCGMGFDLHALGKRDADSPPLKLGGVEIDCPFFLVGHSDGDVVLHALCDAIFSALGEEDLGARFPSSDPAHKGADSAQFVAAAYQALGRQGAIVCNVSITVVALAPKIAPHRKAIAKRIAELLGITPNQVGCTATTTDGLGALGRGEAIAAYAQVLLWRAKDSS